MNDLPKVSTTSYSWKKKTRIPLKVTSVSSNQQDSRGVFSYSLSLIIKNQLFGVSLGFRLALLPPAVASGAIIYPQGVAISMSCGHDPSGVSYYNGTESLEALRPASRQILNPSWILVSILQQWYLSRTIQSKQCWNELKLYQYVCITFL